MMKAVLSQQQQPQQQEQQQQQSQQRMKKRKNLTNKVDGSTPRVPCSVCLNGNAVWYYSDKKHNSIIFEHRDDPPVSEYFYRGHTYKRYRRCYTGTFKENPMDAILDNERKEVQEYQQPQQQTTAATTVQQASQQKHDNKDNKDNNNNKKRGPGRPRKERPTTTATTTVTQSTAAIATPRKSDSADTLRILYEDLNTKHMELKAKYDAIKRLLEAAREL